MKTLNLLFVMLLASVCADARPLERMHKHGAAGRTEAKQTALLTLAKDGDRIQSGECGCLSNGKLEQNYPNPVSRTTTFKYRVGVAESVKLSVFDISGNELAVLVNEPKSPGTYTVGFDAGALSDGIYFYRLVIGGSNVTRQMIVSK